MSTKGGLLLWLATAGLAMAVPKVAVVHISDLYTRLPETVELNARVQAERAALTEDPRLKAFTSVLAELETLQKGLNEAAGQPDVRTRLEREYALKRQEALTLQREYEEFRSRRLDEINSDMIESMELGLEKVRKAAADYARAQGLDWVLEVSGKTNTGMSFVLYSKNPLDITAEVARALNLPEVEAAAKR